VDVIPHGAPRAHRDISICWALSLAFVGSVLLAGVHHYRELPLRPRDRHRPGPTVAIALDDRVRGFLGGPIPRFPLGGDGQRSIAALSLAPSAARHDSGTARAVEDIPRTSRHFPTIGG